MGKAAERLRCAGDSHCPLPPRLQVDAPHATPGRIFAITPAGKASSLARRATEAPAAARATKENGDGEGGGRTRALGSVATFAGGHGFFAVGVPVASPR